MIAINFHKKKVVFRLSLGLKLHVFIFCIISTNINIQENVSLSYNVLCFSLF